MMRRRFVSPCFVVFSLVCAAAPAAAQTGGGAEDQSSATPALPTTAAAAYPSWPNLFTSTLADFKRLPSRDTVTWLTIGGVAAAAGHRADTKLTFTLSTSPALHEPLEAGAVIGGAPFQLGAALATYAFGRAANSSRVATLGADLFRAQSVAQLTTYAVKYSVRRTRPDGSQFGFPSGHAAVTFASATVLQRHFGWKVGLPAYGVASYVAASRLQMNRHYLSDVVFGGALGIAAGRTVTIGRGRAQMTLAPMAAPGGGGLAFTWLGQK